MEGTRPGERHLMQTVDVLVPTCDRMPSLAMTLTALAAQRAASFRVLVSDQSERYDVDEAKEIRAVARLLRLHGHRGEISKHLPRRGIAEQRQFLLAEAQAPYAIFLDDVGVLEPGAVERMLRAIRAEHCGFVGCAVIGLSYLYDVRPDEQEIELWEGPVRPEVVAPGSPAWRRHRLHNAANLLHVQQRLGVSLERPRRYHVAWIGGCGLLPSGAYHLELPTSIPDRRTDAPRVLPCA